jgi:hypothetical protein
VPSRHAKQGYPVGRPRDLSVADLVYLPPQPNNPIGHVRIIDSVEAVGDGVVFTTAESTFDADGPRSMRWRFPDATALANLEWYVDGRWQPAREREHTGSFWRHLPLMHTGLTTIV